jgi:hypothetical protein
VTRWEYDLDTYSYDDGGLAAMFQNRVYLDGRRDEGWYIRETFRGLKGVDVLWEREIKNPETSSPTPLPTSVHEEDGAPITHPHSGTGAEHVPHHPHEDPPEHAGEQQSTATVAP